MSQIVINGGKRLNGEIKIQGAKNSVLPILAATVLCKGESVIHNCPDLSDVATSLKILNTLGVKTKKEGTTVTVDATNIIAYEIPENLMREMRSSVVFLGAILARTGNAIISSPGGCELGPRPIDLHLSSLKKMGATIVEKHGFLRVSNGKSLKGSEITLGFASVGATENIILAAVLAEGTTIIHNAAKEPEICDLADFINKAGGSIFGAGNDTIIIHGVSSLNACEHTIIPDRIAAATYMAGAAITSGMIQIRNVEPGHMAAIISVFRECGCEVFVDKNNLILKAPETLTCVPMLRSLVYPAFPTDAGPIIIAMLLRAKGTSVFCENIFENRFRYVDELKRLGANIKTEGKIAVIEGVESLSGAGCNCTDLRGGAAIVIAGLGSCGTTRVGEIQHIERGYDDIVGNFKALGAEIYEIN